MSVQDVSDTDGEDDVWEEDWGEAEGQECVSLFSDFVVLPSVQACCEYDARHHEFDLRDYVRTVRTREHRLCCAHIYLARNRAAPCNRFRYSKTSMHLSRL